MLFVLFLLAMCDGVMYKCLKSGTLDLHSNLGKQSPARPKPGQQCVEACQGIPVNMAKRECWIRLLLGSICSSTFNTIVAQVCLNKQRLPSFPAKDLCVLRSNTFFILHKAHGSCRFILEDGAVANRNPSAASGISLLNHSPGNGRLSSCDV